ncbi:MAG: hypothetical protein N3J91_10475 [Verrucomicrobiae bacterium]|nr:hypothetical protein [Verrucomicrobiae bacterium]
MIGLTAAPSGQRLCLAGEAGPCVNRQIGVAMANARVEAEGGAAPPLLVIPTVGLRYKQSSFSFALPETVNGKSYVLG